MWTIDLILRIKSTSILQLKMCSLYHRLNYIETEIGSILNVWLNYRSASP